MATISFFSDMIQQITDRGRILIARSREGARTLLDLSQQAEELLSSRGEASGVALAKALLDEYSATSDESRRKFLVSLATVFGPDMAKVATAVTAYQAAPGTDTALELHKASEPRRQELLRRLNRAPGATLALVRMRENVLAMRKEPGMAEVDADFWHLFNSWFNRGFLMLTRMDWTAPAHVLEKIIRYEAVHEIDNFEDLRRRLAPRDRRLYSFFHPALVDEPLIFVEVALTKSIPASINEVLAQSRSEVPEKEATTAVFYSISSCQLGLAGVSFGNFLIKQVVEELRRDLPTLTTFVTLSPIPGFMKWLAAERMVDNSAYLTAEQKKLLDQALLGGALDSDIPAELQDVFLELVATYLLHAKSARNQPLDPVARFHLGNGARLERIHPAADTSKKGRQQSAGFMVSYLYDLDAIERSHEAFAETGEVIASSDVRRLARRDRPLSLVTAR